ncbi:phospholipase A2 inhibitor gamma subunit A-like [Brachyhypopomus gauderio]|uniref:phospholipase A2 inhibitor gamma subunit A-like n=1 Tax=Brachyhypopomus gauderio TaxID=698409 RepID=UPI0040417A80
MVLNGKDISGYRISALALECYHCWPPGPGVCTDTIQCKDVCSSFTINKNSSAKQEKENFKVCMPPSFCDSYSLNYGSYKENKNVMCCVTDRCNGEDVPVLPYQPPNGMKCCSDENCLQTVECQGDEDRCIIANVNKNGSKSTVHGNSAGSTT